MPDQSVFLQVINLDRSPDRLARMRADLGQHNVAFARLAAVDGKDSAPESLGDYDPERSRRLFGRELLTGEVGCYQSHLNAARKFLDSPDNLGLVLEDDVISPDDFAGMIRHLARLAGNLAKWDVMHLGRAATKFRTELIGSGWPIAMPTPFRAYYLPVTTHALLWSRPGAERFLSACSQIVMPVDSALNAHICRFGGRGRLRVGAGGSAGSTQFDRRWRSACAQRSALQTQPVPCTGDATAVGELLARCAAAVARENLILTQLRRCDPSAPYPQVRLGSSREARCI